MAEISVENVSKIFGANPKSVLPMLDTDADKAEILDRTGHVVGLRQVSFGMEAGKIHVVMGLSGSGKSTLIRHFNRLIDPTDGIIRVDGQDILTLPYGDLQKLRQTKISMVFQNFGLMPHRTVIDNVAYGLEVRGEDRATRMTTARHWIDRVGLTGYEDTYPHKLSGGMRQRVGLARGLATDPDILLMDEAFSALDPLIRHDMQGILLDLQRELMKTIIFITHDLDEALAIGDQIAILRDGLLVQVGSPQEIILSPADDYVRRFVGNVNRGRALKVSAIMEPVASGLTGTVPADHTLDAALASILAHRGPVAAVDPEGRPVGTISANLIAQHIAGSQETPT